MEEAEQSRYVAQLKAEFDGCDTTASGFLDREELTALGRKLQLDAHLPLLLRTLLGGRAYCQGERVCVCVNFEEFKDGFVSVLSRSLDFCTSEDDSSYLEPVVPEEVKPKFVKGAKRYGRRSCPDSKPDGALTCDLEESPLCRDEAADSSPVFVHRDKLRRSTSLESIESLKSDEDAGSQKPDFQSKAPLQEEDEGLEEGGGGGHVSLNTEELDSLLRKLDAGLEGRVSIRDFQKFLRGSAPISCSTPVRATDLQRAPHRAQTLVEERSARSTSPSLLTATVGQRVLSRLDDGSGCTSPERVIVLWREEGIRNSRDILQTLDFPLEERLSLADLTLALDNELLVSGNGIQQAALISYKNEIQHLQVMAEQACRERDKVRVDLDLADQRNLKLTLYNQTLYNQTLYNQTLYNQTLYNQTLYNQTLYNQTLYNQTLYNQTLYNQTLYNQTLYNQTLYNQTLYNQTLYNQTLYNQTLYNQTLYNQTLYNQTLYNQTLYNQTLYNQDLYNQTLYNQTLYNQTLYNQTLYNQTLYNQTLYNQTLYNQTLYNQTLYNQTLYNQTLYNQISTTRPYTTRPSTTRPSTTRPYTTRPYTTRPSTTRPSTTRPYTTRPSTTRPSTTRPSTTRPSTTRPYTTRPYTTRPSTTRPSTTRPSTTRPSTTRPYTTRPSTTRPYTTRPYTTRPYTTRPSTTRPSTTRLYTTRPSTTRPSTTRPYTTRPYTTRPYTTRPSTTRPYTTRPSTTRPYTTRPYTTRPSTTRPSTTRPSTTRPYTTRPYTTRPYTTRPSTTRPYTTRPSTTRPSTTRPYTTRLYTTRPYTTRPYTTRPSTTRPSTTRPYTTRPYTTRPYTTRPSTTRPYTTRPYKLAVLRTQSEQESEALLQQVERERSVQQGELQLLRVQEAQLQEELCSAAQENSRLEDELSVVKMKLTEAENSVNKLQRDMKQLLHDKMGGSDPAGAGLSHEERFREVVKEYELQFRELRDRNDELSSELELLKSQRSNRKSRRDDDAALSWTEQHSVSTESDSDDSDMKRHSSPLVKKKIHLDDKSGLDSVSGPVVSIQTELALEQLKQKHNQELQQLHIQLDTQVNYYERSLELMRQSMEVERKDISQAFKLEISELEEHKARAEAQVKQLKEAVDKVQTPHGGGGGGGWSSEQERRVQWERAELEQNFAREIGHLVQRLSAEKDELEAELKLKLDQEVMVVREESEQQLCQMKLQHAEGQRRLLHQLHRERQRLQEQRAFWEKRLEEEQATICGWFSSEKKCMKEQHEEAVRQLREEVFCLQEAVQNADLRIGQSEARLTEFRERCGQLEDDVDASGGRCSELEARLEEACTQLEDSITFLESHEVVSKRLAAEKCSVEEELQQARTREEQLLGQMTQLKEELGNVQAASASILQEQELVADNCSRLSNTFVQLQTQLRARDQTIATSRSELENLQDAMRTKATELDLLKTDRARLIQDLKEQAMAVDNLQLQLDGVSEELDRKRSLEQQLQEVLVKEQTRTSLLQSRLDEEKEEVCRLSQENSSYTLLADQLSTQIVEMEEEISTLRDHLRDLSSQLNETADLVLDLRRQLNSRTSKVDQLRAEVAESAGLLLHVKSSYERQSCNVQLEAKDGELVQVQQLLQALQDSQDQLRTSEDEFEEEKRKMRQQLMELEQLVLALEEVTESPHRTQLEELRSENAALQERLSVLQQEVQNLEEDVSKRRRKLEEMEGEHERSRDEEERLHRENSEYRTEVLDLSSRNLQLGARLHGDQESARMLEERLATVSKEEEEQRATVREEQLVPHLCGDSRCGASRQMFTGIWRSQDVCFTFQIVDQVRRLQEAAAQQEREKLQLQTSWTQERHLLEEELNSCKHKLGGLSELEAELSAVTLKLQWSEEDKSKLLQDADDRSHEVEKLQQSLLTLESEAEPLRSQLHAVSREKLGHAQEVADLQRALDDARNKVEDLETSIRKLMMEKEELCRSLEEQACVALQEESHRQSVQKQELQHKLTEEKQKLKNKVSELEMARMQAESQERASGGRIEQVEQLQERLLEERRRSQQLEETLKLQAQQSSSQISVKQDQYEKAVAALQQRTEDLELKLKAVRSVLQEKVQEVKEQMVKNAKSSALLKDVYVENSQLMKLLQVSEQRQKTAEKNNFLLKEKVGALNRLLREIVPLSLAT
ncbi:unnamed protein product [Pleuronectes platessa]|uniref:Uncharacterized protein n=1 Tax=Pleuronectes platessa TaxID=8262 RepID=A0A9N7TPS0_PLEPL|nr:unnamed protein product [Pleuronectes platessa]